LAWKVEFEARADKKLDKLNPRDAARIIRLLEEIAQLDDPRKRGEALVGPLSGLWRYRAGDWRILTKIEDDCIVIVVIDLGHRREIYRSR
jgi:mRNA interferase RelE/StbE